MSGGGKKLSAREEQTRQRILTHAQRVLMERGFRRVTVEELCAGMAVSKRTFYKYFENRDELVKAVFFFTIEPFVEQGVANLGSDLPVSEKLRRHFDLLIHGVMAKLTLPFMADIETLMPEFWRHIEEIRAKIVTMVAEIVKSGQDEGSMRDGFDPIVMSRLLLRILDAVARPQVAADLGISLSDLVEMVGRMVMTNLVNPDFAEEASDGHQTD